VSESRSTEELVARLVEDAAPVRRIPALRSQLLRVAGAWLATAAVVALWLGLDPAAPVRRGGVSAGVAGALAIVGFAALAAGLAARIPGRERLAGGAALAAATALVSGVGMLALTGAFGNAHWPAYLLDCSRRALAFALPAGVVALSLALRGAGWRESLAGLGLAVGAAALGALLVHMSCPSEDVWHWLLAHAALPAAGGLMLGLLAVGVLRAAAQRAERRARERTAR
jgi:hypothetical protein